ncbi:MAG: lipoprotein signal peptidase [Rikenellaceae bacterium]
MIKDIFKKNWGIASFILLLLIIDQVVKIYIKTHMTINEAIPVFGEWFYIRFIENEGAAYGMKLGGDYGKLILSVFRVIMIVVLSIYVNKLRKKETPIGIIIGFLLIIAGALGNIIDSAFYGLIFSQSTYSEIAHFVPWGQGYETFLHGWVVDMLYFPIINTTLPEWVPVYGGQPYIFFSPIFNIADSYISIGFIYMLLFQRKHFK